MQSIDNIISTQSRVEKYKHKKRNKIKNIVKYTIIFILMFLGLSLISMLIIDSIRLDRLERKILRDMPMYIKEELKPYIR